MPFYNKEQLVSFDIAEIGTRMSRITRYVNSDTDYFLPLAEALMAVMKHYKISFKNYPVYEQIVSTLANADVVRHLHTGDRLYVHCSFFTLMADNWDKILRCAASATDGGQHVGYLQEGRHPRAATSSNDESLAMVRRLWSAP